MNLNEIKVSERIRTECSRLNISQRKLSADTGITETTISKLMNGQPPRLETLLILADYFGVSLDYLTGRIDQKNHDLQFVCDFTGLSETAAEELHNSQSCAGDLHEIISILAADHNISSLLNAFFRINTKAFNSIRIFNDSYVSSNKEIILDSPAEELETNQSFTQQVKTKSNDLVNLMVLRNIDNTSAEDLTVIVNGVSITANLIEQHIKNNILQALENIRNNHDFQS